MLAGLPDSLLKSFPSRLRRISKEPGFKVGYDALQEEFTIASVLIEARVRANLSQQQLAERMGTSQSTIARLESGTAKPSFTTSLVVQVMRRGHFGWRRSPRRELEFQKLKAEAEEVEASCTAVQFAAQTCWTQTRIGY